MKKYLLYLALILIASFFISGWAIQNYTGYVIYLDEGESAPVSPEYACSAGLTSISCNQPGENSTCEACTEIFYCTKCGDGVCTEPENRCNCARDCGKEAPGNIFVTNESFTGNLGGLEGADAKCQEAAGNAGYRGTWVALLSTSYMDAHYRIMNMKNILNMKGFGIAKDHIDLSDGNILNRILTEYGEEHDGLVWTGSYAYDYLIYTERACNDWTSGSSSDKGTSGNSMYMNSDWMEWNIGQSCSVKSSLYCVKKS